MDSQVRTNSKINNEMEEKKLMDKNFDVVVIGGGPAGIIAAGFAAANGNSVALIEKNMYLGKKLLMTGNGRCNLSNNEAHLDNLIKMYKEEGNFLYSSLSNFGVLETIEFFNKIGLKTKTEEKGKIFPKSNKAIDVIKVLKNFLNDNNVKVLTNSLVKDLKIEGNSIKEIIFQNFKILPKHVILCTGGKSYPHTGSTGEGFQWAKKMGHKIIKLTPALSPIKTEENFVKDIQGISLKDISLQVTQNNKKILKDKGDIIFTHFGLSGPVILNISGEIPILLQKGEVKIILDLIPNINLNNIENKIKDNIMLNKNKAIIKALNISLPQRLLKIILNICNIPLNKKNSTISKKEILKLSKNIKNLPFTVTKAPSFKNAMLTKGGIDLKEINPKSLKSKIINNLSFAGEILNIQGPTGGYNLQICWTTGHCAGKNSQYFI